MIQSASTRPASVSEHKHRLGYHNVVSEHAVVQNCSVNPTSPVGRTPCQDAIGDHCRWRGQHSAPVCGRVPSAIGVEGICQAVGQGEATEHRTIAQVDAPSAWRYLSARVGPRSPIHEGHTGPIDALQPDGIGHHDSAGPNGHHTRRRRARIPQRKVPCPRRIDAVGDQHCITVLGGIHRRLDVGCRRGPGCVGRRWVSAVQRHVESCSG